MRSVIAVGLKKEVGYDEVRLLLKHLQGLFMS